VKREENAATRKSDADAPLPDFLRPLFWDTDFDQLRVPGHEPYIIERVLEYGSDPAITWLWRAFGPSAIVEVVQRSRRISRRTANLWTLILDIPRDRIRCFSEHSQIIPNVF
jgi:hypothetical protein